MGIVFFQSSFHPDEKGTILSVNHDQWGTGITYAGYTLLYLGLLGIMFFGKTRFRELGRSLKKLKAKKAKLATMIFLGLACNVSAQEHTEDDGHDHNAVPTQQQLDSVLRTTIVSEEHAERFGKLIIQDEGGRMKPINTFSSELLRKLSRKDKFKDMNSDQVFLSMMMNPPLWYNMEFINLSKDVKNDSIRHILGVPEGQKYVKATDFFEKDGSYKLEPVLREATATNNPDAFEKDVEQAHIRVSLLNQALSGEIIKIFPLLNDENNKWISAVEFRSGRYQVSDSLYANFIKNALPYYLMTLQKANQTGDYADANKLLAAFHQNQKNHGSEVLPSVKKVNTEVMYNKLNIFNHLYKLYGLVGVLMFFVLIWRIFTESGNKAKLGKVSNVRYDTKRLGVSLMPFVFVGRVFRNQEIWKAATFLLKGTIIILFLWHTAGLALRWYISGHAPWSDAYESIIYVSWATMGMGLLFARKSDLTLAATAFVTCMLLTIASMNWVDPAISNLVPVLDSYWLMIHVAVIVASYGPLTVGMILGVVSLLLMIMTNKRNKKKMDINIRELTIINELALTVGLVMLTIGNFLGGQWANESWGRYWGWDPKETWALISIMIYAFVIHTRLIPGLRGRWTFNLLSVAAYGSIMMTYFGVNYYLVGLHSYGQSGAAAITPDYVWYIVLGVGILGAISYWRYRVNYSK